MVDFLEKLQHSKAIKVKIKRIQKNITICRNSLTNTKIVLDLKKNIAKGKQKVSLNNKMMSIRIERFPFTFVNRIVWNPNAWSYLWPITGYQNGLARLLNFRSMSTFYELNARLSVKSMLAEERTS